MGLIVTGIDNDVLYQNAVAVRFDPDKAIGKASTAEMAYVEWTVINDTGVDQTLQDECSYDKGSQRLFLWNVQRATGGYTWIDTLTSPINK